MRCFECGKENPKGAAFCGQCGAKLQSPPADSREVVSAVVTRPSKPLVVEPEAASSHITNRRKYSIGIVTVVVAVIALGTFGLFRMRQHQGHVATGENGVTSSEQTALRYNLTDLTLLANLDKVNGINNEGEILGTQYDQPGCHGIIWRDGQKTDLGTYPGFVDTHPLDINDAGQVLCIGGTREPHNINRTIQWFVWQERRTTAIGEPQSFIGPNEVMVAINSKGQVIGNTNPSNNPMSDTRDDGKHSFGFLWDKGQKTMLGDLGGGTSVATGINASCQVVGVSLNQSKEVHGFLWQNGKMSDLGPVGEHGGISINDKGDIVGDSPFDRVHSSHAFLLQSGRKTNLQTLNALDNALDYNSADSINNNGDIVGSSSGVLAIGHGSEQHAVIWKNGHLYDLNDCIASKTSWILTAATKINDKGQIFAEGDNAARNSHWFLLTPQ